MPFMLVGGAYDCGTLQSHYDCSGGNSLVETTETSHMTATACEAWCETQTTTGGGCCYLKGTNFCQLRDGGLKTASSTARKANNCTWVDVSPSPPPPSPSPPPSPPPPSPSPPPAAVSVPFSWVVKGGGSGADEANAVTTDGTVGGAIVGGQFKGTASFGGVPSLTTAGTATSALARAWWGVGGRGEAVARAWCERVLLLRACEFPEPASVPHGS